VRLGADRLRPRPEIGNDPLQGVVEEAARAFGRRQVPAGAVEEVGAGVADPGGLGAGERVAADEALVVAEGGDQVSLGRADVGDDGLGTGGLERRAAELGQRGDRRRADDDLRPRAGCGDALGPAVDRADLDGPLERRRLRVITDDLGPRALPGGESDRAPDQADAEDREGHRSRRLRAAAASPSSRETVVSQLMQASVIDWP
jgi:hypothetical protein